MKTPALIFPVCITHARAWALSHLLPLRKAGHHALCLHSSCTAALIGLIALHSPQTKSNRRMTITLERAIYLYFCFIFQLNPHVRAHVHAYLSPPLLSFLLGDNLNAGILVVMGF